MSSSTIDLERYIRTGQVALRLRMTPSRVRQLVEAGQLKAEPSPFGFLYLPEDVEEFSRIPRPVGRPARKQRDEG